MTHWKRPWCWEGLGAGGEGDDRGWDGWMASPTRCTWIWVNSGSWWWTGRPGMLQFMGSQRVGHDWATELNRTELYTRNVLGTDLSCSLTSLHPKSNSVKWWIHLVWLWSSHQKKKSLKKWFKDRPTIAEINPLSWGYYQCIIYRNGFTTGPTSNKNENRNDLFASIAFVVVQSLSCVWLSNAMNCSMPGFSVLHHFSEFAQTHVHWVCDAIQPSHPLMPLSPLALNLSQH